MYSRSYGSIESDRKPEEFSIPPDYNGSLYRRQQPHSEPPKKTEVLPVKEEAPVIPPPVQTPHTNGMFGSLLEKFSAEDIILFVLVFALLKDDNGDPGVILAVILALLLL